MAQFSRPSILGTLSRMNDDQPSILAQLDSMSTDLHAFALKLETLLKDVLSESSIAVHSVSNRVKSRESLQRKLSKPGAAYRDLADMTDVVGVRIICYFDDDVDRVAGLMESEFIVDEASTTDKRRALDPDRFGYLSLHHVVNITPARAAMTDWKRFVNLKAEIQTRSILQHAWAEIEHDLGYKSRVEVPRHLRRRFSRVAGLLELADEEFHEIRDELRRYSEEVVAYMAKQPASVLLDSASVRVFIEREPLVKELDQAIARVSKTRLETDVDSDLPTRRLRAAGIHNLGDLQAQLSSHAAVIVRFAQTLLEREEPDQVSTFMRGVSLFYLAYVLVIEAGDDETLRDFLGHFNVGLSVPYMKAIYQTALRDSAGA